MSPSNFNKTNAGSKINKNKNVASLYNWTEENSKYLRNKSRKHPSTTISSKSVTPQNHYIYRNRIKDQDCQEFGHTRDYLQFALWAVTFAIQINKKNRGTTEELKKKEKFLKIINKIPSSHNIYQLLSIHR